MPIEAVLTRARRLSSTFTLGRDRDYDVLFGLAPTAARSKQDLVTKTMKDNTARSDAGRARFPATRARDVKWLYSDGGLISEGLFVRSLRKQYKADPGLILTRSARFLDPLPERLRRDPRGAFYRVGSSAQDDTGR